MNIKMHLEFEDILKEAAQRVIVRLPHIISQHPNFSLGTQTSNSKPTKTCFAAPCSMAFWYSPGFIGTSEII